MSHYVFVCVKSIEVRLRSLKARKVKRNKMLHSYEKVFASSCFLNVFSIFVTFHIIKL